MCVDKNATVEIHLNATKIDSSLENLFGTSDSQATYSKDVITIMVI